MSGLNAQQLRLSQRATAVQGFLNQNIDTYNSLSPFAAQVTLLIANNERIIELTPGTGPNGKSTTRKKASLKASIAKRAGLICSFASDYALNIKDNTLYNATNFTTTHILQLRDAAIVGFVNTLVGVIEPVLSLLIAANYPITADDLDALSTDATAFNSDLGKAARIDTDSSIVSGDINAVLADIQGNLNRLNRLLKYFKDDNPAFVTGYRKAIRVDNSDIRHGGIEGIITNSSTDQPVIGATITLAGKKKTKNATTNSNGGYKISPFAAGKSKLTIAAHGYESKIIEVHIQRGKITELNINISSQVIEFKTA